ncbi:MAG: universal stress protein [Anaerolineales bacterium]|nr:MAG: universal stress protein [Anaerolineales bacterium]
MNQKNLQLLLCTNGDPASYAALEYGVWIAKILRIPVILLGILEGYQEEERLVKLINQTSARLKEQGIPHLVQYESGRSSIVIPRLTASRDFITVVGPLGRPTWMRIFQGRSFRRILSRVETPIFYVRETRTRLENILVCMGGLGYSTSVQSLCLSLAKITGAKVTLLHIVEPVSYRYPISRDIVDHWDTIYETDTPQGRNLRQAKARFESAGLSVYLKIRHGSPVHEILEEILRGQYDLVGLGSPYSAYSLRHIFMPNVTAEVAEAITCPVVTVRFQHRPAPWEIKWARNHDTQHDRK